MVVLIGAVAGSVLTWIHRGGPWAPQVATQVSILVPAVGAIIALIRLMPPQQTWPVSNAVGELRDGAVVVGRAVRVGSRHLICPSGPVCTMLSISDADARELVPGRHLTVYFPAGSPGNGGVEAKVVAWGPALRRQGRPQVAVLSTSRQMPPSVPRLSLARHPHRGRAHVIVPDPGAVSSATTWPKGNLNGPELADLPALPPGAPGSPVLPGEPDTTRRDVVAIVGADTGGSVPAPPPGTGHSVPLVTADDAQLVLDRLSRRQALRWGALCLGLAAVTIGGGATKWPRSPHGPDRRRVSGVGWRNLFDNPDIQDGLSTGLRAAGLGASSYVFDVARKSGVESLAMLTPERLHSFDFLTCPNDAVRDSMEGTIQEAGRPWERHKICQGSMVLLVRRRAVQALQRAHLLFREQGESETEVRFDVLQYFLGYGRSRTWKAVDPYYAGEYAGDPIRIGFSDPCHAGGGALFLATLRQAQTDLARSGRLPPLRAQEEWLWGEDGPLAASGSPTTMNLLRAFLDGGQDEMVFVYEHDAMGALLDRPERVENIVLLRTSPEAGYKQYLLSLSPVGEVVGRTIAGPLAGTLFQHFRLRANEMDDEVDRLMAGEVLAKARCPPGSITRRDPVGARTVTFQHEDLMRLVKRLQFSSPASP